MNNSEFNSRSGDEYRMPSPEKHSLELILAPELAAVGFKKRGSTWRRVREAVIQVINLDGSQWSKRFYLNLGIYLVDLGTIVTPSIVDCHIQLQLANLVPDQSRVDVLLDLENKRLTLDESQELLGLLNSFGVAWLDSCSFRESVYQELAKYRALIRREVWGWFGLEPGDLPASTERK